MHLRMPMLAFTLTYAWRNGIPQNTRSYQRNALGWFVTNEHTTAEESKVLYLLPRSNVAELDVMMITGNCGGNVE